MAKKYPLRPETYSKLIKRNQTSAPLEFLEALAIYIAARYQVGVILARTGNPALVHKGKIWEREYGAQLRELTRYVDNMTPRR